jgi:hypothetical protein
VTVPLGQNFVSGAQAARIVQRTLEAAPSTSADDLTAALSKVDNPAGDPDLYLLKADGLRFGENRFPTDLQNLIVQWNADGSQDVVWPPAFAMHPPAL